LDDNDQLGGEPYFGLTTVIGAARRYAHRTAPFESFIGEIFACAIEGGDIDVVSGAEAEVARYEYVGGDFVALGDLAGQGPHAFADWVRKTAWLEIPAPPTPYYLRRFDGIVWMRSEWTSDLRLAHRFKPSDVLIGQRLDDARQHGRFVSINAAEHMRIMPPADLTDEVNHALEADVAWTLYRLACRYPRMEKSARHRAFRHAGAAGWNHAARGEDIIVSGHISAFPELLEAFETGRALFHSLKVSGHLGSY
jgi:hypothetical protein